MESTRGNTHSVTFFPPGNVFFGSMISTMHPLTTNTAAVLRGAPSQARRWSTGPAPAVLNAEHVTGRLPVSNLLLE
jgi:hypothetical protein